MKFLLVAQCLLLVNVASAYYGQQGFDTDSSTVISNTTFNTLLNNGYSVFLGVYYNGAVVSNPSSCSGIGAGYVANGVTNIVNGRSVYGNYRIVDAIHVPKYAAYSSNGGCQYCAPGSILPPPYCKVQTYNNIYTQARYTIDFLNSAVQHAHLTAGIGRTWVLIQQGTSYGWSSVSANQAYFNKFASYFPALGPQLGVITTQADFQAVFGTTYQPVDGNNNTIPLMLADCQSPQDSGSYFTGFNGWSAPTDPAIHRYQCGVLSINGTGIVGNLDYY